MHDYVCVDGCCSISYDDVITLQSESNKNTTFNRLSEDLNISMLNVCGISSKLDIPDFTEFIESHTINCFVETKINYLDIDNLNLPQGYNGKFKCRNYCSKVKSGGIGIIYKDSLETFITEITTDSEFVGWYRISKDILEIPKDLLLGVVYIPPEGSKYTKIEAFEECELELLELLSCNDSLVCLCGDFNARTGGLHDELEYNIFNDFGCDGITRSMNTGVESHYERKNDDKQCSKYGMLLIELCKTANLVIVNGRMTNASSSNTTFRNISTIDYVLCCPLLFKYINNFIVHENNPMFSDGHSALELSIDTSVVTIHRCIDVSRYLSRDMYRDTVCSNRDTRDLATFLRFLFECHTDINCKSAKNYQCRMSSRRQQTAGSYSLLKSIKLCRMSVISNKWSYDLSVVIGHSSLDSSRH